MGVYFFYGDEDYNIDLELESMHSKLNPDFISMSYKVLDNPEYNQLIPALRTTPMMFGNMLIIINAEKYFLSNKNYFSDTELEDIEDALNNTSESLDIVFVVKIPREDNKKIDSRRKLYKILVKHNSTEFPVYKTYKTAEILAWVNKRAKQKKITLKSDAAELLVEFLGNNLRQFDTELDKLCLIAYPENIVTREMVSKIAVSNQDLFNITELIMKNQKDKALLEFKKLTDKKHPLEILAAIQTILKKWILIKLKSQEMSNAELSKLVGQHEFVVKQTLQKLKNTSISDLVKLKENLFETEFRIKNAESIDIMSEVEVALIR